MSPAINNRLEKIRKKEDMLRRKQSQRELRKLMSIRGYWTKEVNRRYDDFFSPVFIKHESQNFSDYIFPNETGKRTIEKFLKANRYRVYEKLRINKKVSYTLKVTLIKFTDGEPEEMKFHIVKPFFILLTKKDFRESYNSLLEFFYEKLAEIKKRGSGWMLKSIDYLRVKLVKYTPMRGGCFRMELPTILANRKIFPILKTDDDECFKWSICYLLFGGKEGEITNKIREKSKTLNWDKIEFPAEERDIPKFEKNNPDYLVYCYSYIDKEFGIFYKNKKFHELKDERTVINLLFYNNHFFPIMNEKYLHNLIFNSERKYFVCKNCLTNYSSQKDLDIHYEYCQKELKIRIVYPKKGEKLKFNKLFSKEYSPYICYIDGEANLKPVNIVNKKTVKYQKHEVSYFGLLFVNNLSGECEYNVFDNPHRLIRKLIDYSELLNVNIGLKGEEKKKADAALELAKECGHCGCEFTKENHAVRDHCHFTGKFRKIICNSCNLKYQKSKFLPVFGHNLMKYDEKLFIRALSYKTNVIAKNIENFITFDLKNYSIKFVDSYKFLQSSLEDLVENLRRKGEENFKFTQKMMPNNLMDLCLRKGVMCYDYISSDEVLDEKRLPPKKDFYSKLKEKHISDEDYEHAKNVWKKFNCKTLTDYLKLYLKLDCLLLADVCENFRKSIFDFYELDPAKYITLPSLSQDCALKFTGQELELISDPNIYNFIESGIRGGVSMVVRRFAQANNPCMKERYDPEKETSYLTYYDANNLYGCAMCEELPVSDFKFWDGEEEYDWENNDCILDVDIHCPPELEEKFSDFPLCPSHENGKLLSTFSHKKGYVCHSKYLKNVLEKGYCLDKINRILTFKSKAWLKPYILKNNELRSRATSVFEKNLWKLMNNAVYGKQIENVRKRVNIVHSNEYEIEKYFLKPTFKDIKKLDKIYLLKMNLNTVKLDKPIYGGLAILDFSKIIMNDFLYDYLIPKFGENHKLIYTDTDSFISQIYCKDFYEEILPDIDEYFDTSNYPPDFKTPSGKTFPQKNKKVLGKFKDELQSIPMDRFVGLRSKMYAYEYGGKSVLKNKGATEQSIRDITFDDYLNVLENDLTYFRDMHVIRSYDHTIYTETIHKKVLDGRDEKRQILEDGIETIPWR